uniref:Uncharacterized protein n=1 Tax=Globodera rostochiensis TaxID=31243 RepID=A0A914H6H3_GLORO
MLMQLAESGLNPTNLSTAKRPHASQSCAAAVNYCCNPKYAAESSYGDIKVTLEEFAENLSMEWASFPCSADGISYYHAGGKNVAHAPWRTETDKKGITKIGLLDIVEEAKTMFDKEEEEIKRQKIVAEKREKEEAEKKEASTSGGKFFGFF